MWCIDSRIAQSRTTVYRHIHLSSHIFQLQRLFVLDITARLAFLQNEVLEHSVKSLTDELQDVRAERDVFQQKAHRLNVEMNHIVGNDEIRILDIDALCMENRSASPIEDLWFSQLIQRRGKNV